MIQHLNHKKNLDVSEFFSRVEDKYEDMYITINKERKFLKNNYSLIKKILRRQEVYAIYDKEIKGIMIILHEKGFRPYIKLLTENTKYNIDLLKFLKWNFEEVDLYAKFKKDNPLSNQILKTGFIKIGDRGKEILFFKKGIKPIYKIIPKCNGE